MDQISRDRAMGARPIETVGITAKVKPETVAAVDCWMTQLPHGERPSSRGDAVRQLLDEMIEEKRGGRVSRRCP
jgi:hypothetical protein